MLSNTNTMIKCLLANNDSVVDKFLSESVLELEYLEQKVCSGPHISLSNNVIIGNSVRFSLTQTENLSQLCSGS